MVTEELFSRRGARLAVSWAGCGLAVAWLVVSLTVPVSVLLALLGVVAVAAAAFMAGWATRGRADAATDVASVSGGGR